MVMIRGGRVKDFPASATTSSAAPSTPWASPAGSRGCSKYGASAELDQTNARRREVAKRRILPTRFRTASPPSSSTT